MIETLAQALPAAEFTEHHEVILPAPPAEVWPALVGVSWGELRWTKPLVAVRGLGRGRSGTSQERLFEHGPVRLMKQVEQEYAAAGRISQPWRARPAYGPDLDTLDDLAAFAEPGWLKLGMDFRLHPLPGSRTRLETNTLCEPTDADARARFVPYWRLIRPFSGLIRRDLLAAVARSVRSAARVDSSVQSAPDDDHLGRGSQ